jgi:hypothetical protein
MLYGERPEQDTEEVILKEG